jgi:hypothetical protein
LNIKGKGGDTIKIIPITLKTANDFVTKHHRHHSKAQGCKFCIGVTDDKGLLRGVAIVGRPVSRFLDNGITAEVTRCCTDGYGNACSFLYAACGRIAKHMGYDCIITYILATEKGTSLKASDWTRRGLCGGNSWDTPSRPRPNSPNLGKKVMYSKKL